MKLINVFPSQSAAAKAIGIKSSSNIRRAVETGWKSHGYYWRRISVDEYENFINKK